MSVRISCDRWDIPDQPVYLFVSDVFVFINSFADQTRILLRVHSREGSQGTTNDPHWMGIISEWFHQLADIRVQKCVLHDFVGEIVVFLRSWQLSVYD